MNYRYQEILSWIIPGFYLIMIWIIITFVFNPVNEAALKNFATLIKDYNITDAMTVILVFILLYRPHKDTA